MPTPNIPQVQTANTFDQWRIYTNNTINAVNELRSTTYEKEAGLLYLSNTDISTALLVAGNATVQRTLTVGNLIAANANITNNLIATNANITNNLTATNANITGTLTLAGVNIAQALSNAANTVMISANNGATLTASRLNFVNTSAVTVSVTSGLNGNANVSFTVSGGVGAQGVQGAPGTGTPGAQGVQGPPGSGGGGGGPPGVQGPQGPQGFQGVQGHQGFQGVQGHQGFQGVQGHQGFQGVQGHQGFQGVQGRQGFQGVQGETGPSTAINATNDTSTNPLYPVLVGADGSNEIPKVSKTKLSYNANSGRLTATEISGTHYGDGSSLTSLNASQLSSGTVPGDRGVTSGSATSSFVEYNGTTSTTGQFDGGTTAPSATTRLNYNGYLYATRFYGDGSGLTSVAIPASPQFTSLGVGTAASGVTGEIRALADITAYYSSDRRLKENIRKIENALELIHQINGVRYEWKDEHIKERGGEDGVFVRKEDVGVIAQELQSILPEIVVEREDGMLAVRYEKIVALLIEAIKELDQKHDNLVKHFRNI